MKVSEAIGKLEKQLESLSEIVELPLTPTQKEKVLDILARQDKVITSLEDQAQSTSAV